MRKSFELRTAIVIALCSSLVACGKGASFGLVPTEENFGQEIKYNNKVDIIFMIDNSSSMDANQRALASAMPGLVEGLTSLDMDMHIAVVTSSMSGTNPNGGRFMGTPRYLTSKTPDLKNVLADRLRVGEDGSSIERGVDSLVAATDPGGYLNGAGKGFWREDALLVFIALTNEDDKSVVQPAQFVEIMNQRKPRFEDGSQSWFLNVLGIVELGGGCPTHAEYEEPSIDWMEIARLSGGRQASICSSDFSPAIVDIRQRIVQILTDFELKKKPNIDTIVVTVDGQLVPRSNVNGWDYVPEGNLIRFYGSAVPGANAKIVVDFDPAEAN